MQKFIPVIAVALVAATGGFFGGMKYTQSKTPVGRGAGAFANLTPEERQARVQQFGGAGGIRQGSGANGGFTTGEVIARDDKSITVKLANGGSKIIFISDATKVTKSADGILADIVTGKEISAAGSPNQDGSMTATSIQLRPQLPITQ